MDLHWRNKGVKILLLIAFLFLVTSCGSTKTISETETVKRTEKVRRKITRAIPYTVSASHKLKIDKKGIINPVHLELQHNKTKATLSIKNNVVKYTLKSNDTSVIKSETIIKKTTNTDKKQVVEKKLGFFQKLWKNINVILITAGVVALLIVLAKVFLFAKKIVSPI